MLRLGHSLHFLQRSHGTHMRKQKSGASIPLRPFPPCFRFPPIFPPVSDFPLFWKHFQTLKKIFTILPFLEKFLDFHPPKFLMAFFSHRPQISNFPPFFLFKNISPLFRENYYFPPTLTNFPPPSFTQIHLFFTHFA